VLNHRQVQGRGVFHRAPHQGSVHDGLAVVGQGDDARFLQIPEFRHLPAFRAQADGADGIDVGEIRLGGFPADELRD
jgi:hypothetical protein